MLIRRRSASQVLSSEITPEGVYLQRREWLKTLGLAGLGAALAAPGPVARWLASGALVNVAQAAQAGAYDAVAEAGDTPLWLKTKIAERTISTAPMADTLTPYRNVSGYNNFYEFGLEKSDPARFEQTFKAHPWTIEIVGAVDKPGRYTLEDFIKPHHLEDRIYRFRCVEAWSMVIPWLGIPLKNIIETVKPRAAAKYVAFVTLDDAAQFPGQKDSTLAWPYVEGLRIDEAMHPLTLMAVGVYGRSLPAQNGAPLRLVVPWKYGFKSIKSIVKMEFVERQPPTTWNRMAPSEYGFYANVNPDVDHPRWTQSRERRLPNTLFDPNWRPTQRFNGYQDDVASLYSGMDLRVSF